MSVELKEFKCNVHIYKIQEDCPRAPIYIAGNLHSIDEAEEIHFYLGQLIKTAKSMDFQEKKN